MKNTQITLRGSTALSALVLAGALIATPAMAQDSSSSTTSTSKSTNAQDDQSGGEIVVTGSILRRTDTETPSPVTVLSAETLEQRGVNTVAEALQRLSANGSGTISEGWNNGNNFAAGANAVSLRGLTVQKTLTIFDGMRMAPYPLADDGHRNFVDLSTVPDAIIDRIEVLKDGASSTYGADAVAGVVNVITKKEVKGIHANASAGISSRGDGGEQRFDLTLGHGDLEEQGFNVYINGFYRKNDEIWARDRQYPFGSGDNSAICEPGTPATGLTTGCMPIATRWYQFGVNRNGTLGGSTISVNPLVAAGTAAGGRTGEYQLLNSDCGAFGLSPITLPNSARQLNTAGTLYSWAPNQCTGDLRKLYGTVRPSTERYGFATRATIKVGDNAEAYITGNYMHVNTYSQLTPAAFNNQTPPPGPVTLNPIVLPVYVCAAGVATINPATGVNTSTGCSAANGTLNPNNPFAAAGTVALLRGRYDRPQTVETNARSLRGAAGIRGSFGENNDWNYNFEFTASQVELSRISQNYLIPQRLADVIATGAYNFVNPWLNTQAVRDYVAPTSIKRSTSDLWQVNATLGRALFELPGGPLQAAVGASYRHEAINDASANAENLAHPYDRYYTINAVGAIGSRNIKSAFYEISAPIVKELELSASGRYDDYSSGQTNFSPKFGAKLKPIEQILLRGTWSKGFRIPSFNEAYGLPTTGYTTLSINCTTYAAFCASHGNNTYVTGQYSLGRTSVGNPALAPEKSTSWTAGAVFEPIRNLSFTIDYFNIKVKDVIGNISAADQDAALAAYLNSGATTAVPGVVVVPGTADAQFPAARPLPGFIQFSFQNADEERVQGIDLGFEFRHDFGGVKLYSSFDSSYLIKYEVLRQDGSVERYDGSLSPCDYTSCSGSPKWRGSWQNTLSMGGFSLTGTVYYTGGYSLGSVDYGGNRGTSAADCRANIGHSVVTYQNGNPVLCKVGAQWNADLSASYRVNDNFMIYVNALNFLDIKPKFDPSAAYSIFNYNPSWAQANVVGRYFRVGTRIDF
ncbi:TonB-dependent receptor plug domain-containing protein [Sphingomonas leidyi]|uniref:TonB-dependent receptor plug domain-containing protein n=1 Tax=Sphingomonas leidyi TaxID=68569 RepID=UPI003BA8C7F7